VLVEHPKSIEFVEKEGNHVVGPGNKRDGVSEEESSSLEQIVQMSL
jgi:hypothetical protein